LIAIGSITDYQWLNPNAEVSTGPLVFSGNSMSTLATLSTGKSLVLQAEQDGSFAVNNFRFGESYASDQHY